MKGDWLRRAFLASLVIFCVSHLPGCAVNDQGWETTPSHAPLPAYFTDVDSASLQRICGPRANWINHGCAFRNYVTNRCTIYVESSAPHWLATHELEHCAGFDHPQ